MLLICVFANVIVAKGPFSHAISVEATRCDFWHALQHQPAEKHGTLRTPNSNGINFVTFLAQMLLNSYFDAAISRLFKAKFLLNNSSTENK